MVGWSWAALEPADWVMSRPLCCLVMPLRVTRIEYWLVHQHMRPGTINGPEPEYNETRWDEVPKYLVRLETSEGISGVGEAPRGLAEEALVTGAKALLGKDLLKLDLTQLPVAPGGAYK